MEEKLRRPSYNEANRQIDALIGEKIGDSPKNDVTLDVEAQRKPRCGLGKGLNLYADDGCYLLQEDNGDQTHRQFWSFAKALNLIGLRFDPLYGCQMTFLRFIWLLFMISVGFWTAAYDTWCLSVEFHLRNAPSTLAYMALVVQGVCSMLFLTHWQRRLSFEAFFHTFRHAKIDEIHEFDADQRRSSRRISRQFWCFQTYIMMSGLSYFVVIFLGREGDMMHPRYIYTFYFTELRFLRPVLAMLYFTVVSLGMHTYLCLSNALYWEVKKFNHKVTHLKCLTSMEMRNKLEDLIHLHTRISRSVRALDDIYKIYAFVTTSCVIPTTLFVLSLMLSRANATELALSTPAVAFCVYEYYAIMYPAKLHQELMKSKSFLCMNHHVWVPYEKSVNKVAHTLVMHLDQTDLGISLWGFALVTKPLILTTVSVMMTCLAFFWELKPKDGYGQGGFVDRQPNFTLNT